MSRTGLDRFVDAQADVYPTALAELRAGHKRGHWMWFIFPQIAGLGTSAMSRAYAIRSLSEARDYLSHPLLGARLSECTAALVVHTDVRADNILGGIDAAKLRSSMTLFDAVADGETLFSVCLAAFFGGDRDAATLRLIAPDTQ